MIGKAVQSQAGNITVMATENSLFIWTDNDGYVVYKPETSEKAIEIEFSDLEPINNIKARIDEAFANKRTPTDDNPR